MTTSSQATPMLADLDPATTVVVATHNAHKLAELKSILQDVLPGMTFVALSDLGDFEEPEETGHTFFDNATIKARAALVQTGLTMAVADDSGICVDVLDGAPGVLSARYCGHHGDDAANNAKLLEVLAPISEDHRRAHFHSTVVFIDGPDILRGDGDVWGRIGHEERGAGGFGYDPLFIMDDEVAELNGKTMAELSPAEKNAVSHRFRALKQLAERIAARPPRPEDWDEAFAEGDEV